MQLIRYNDHVMAVVAVVKSKPVMQFRGSGDVAKSFAFHRSGSILSMGFSM